MDSKSHLLFAGILLEKTGLDTENAKWGVSPDIDYSKEGMIHRVSLHTLNRLDKIEEEGISRGYLNASKTEIALCVSSHLWLDMFSAPVWSFFQMTPVPSFKFNLWKYYIPNYGLTSAIKEFKKDMTQLTYRTPDEFHEESTEIFKDVPDGSDPNYMISVLVKELWNNTWHISDRPLGSVLSKISEYTGQDLLTLGDDQFEISEDYAQLLKKYAEEA